MDKFTLEKIEFGAICEILAGFCRCSMGKSLCGRIMPSRNPETVRKWLGQTSQMLDALGAHGLPPFGGVIDISDAMTRMYIGGGATGEDFADVCVSLEGVGMVRDYLDNLPESYDKLRVLSKRFEDFQPEVDAIRAVVGPDGEVRDNASARLMHTRRDISRVDQEIHDVVRSYLNNPEVARLLQSPNLTVHGDRYVLPVRVENRGRLPGVVHRTSNTGATVFVEPNASVELNNRLMDLKNDERREVRRLLNELSVKVSQRAEAISDSMRLLAQIDVLTAKAQYAYQFDMICPEMDENGIVQVDKARHPLLMDQAYRQGLDGVPPEKRQGVVPIDIRLGSEFDLLVITGSNTGGKTVTLKTLALLVVMAQSGMHIPAQRGAKLPVFREVLIDIGDEQSLEQSLSTFGGHIARLRHIVQHADKATLVLLDELGSGTDPDEGGAIGQAVLDKLRDIGCMGVVSTHLSVLKAYAFNHERVDNASVDFDTKTLRPTYHLRIGTPGESHAITVAKRLGLGKDIVAAARRHYSSQGEQFRKAIHASGVARKVAEEARAEARDAHLAATDQQEQYEAKLADLHKVQEDFQGWLASLPQLQAGDEVYVPSVGAKCTLVRMEYHKQIALVTTGAVEVEVPLTELMPDVGQDGVRKQIAELRRRIMDQATQAEESSLQAKHHQEEYHKSVQLHRKRTQQFEDWTRMLTAVKIGDEVTFDAEPGIGTLVSIDFATLKAVVKAEGNEQEITVQQLFPQSGKHAPQAGKGRKGHRAAGGGGKKEGNQVVCHRSAGSKGAKKSRDAILNAKPGDQVYVIPFSKRATLIRIQQDKGSVLVQSGAFEMEVSLADIEPVGNQPG